MDIEHTFFSGGGAEAVETAWKIARRYHALRGEPGRTKAIARRGAYHGLTIGTLSLTDDPGLIECNTKQVKGLVLKTEFLKKA